MSALLAPSVADLASAAVIARSEILATGVTVKSCVLSVRVLKDVLDYFGIDSRPQAVGVVAFNAEGWELAGRNVPQSEWPPSAWSVGVKGTGLVEQRERSYWDGHLVLLVGDIMIDPSLDQLARPERGINVAPTAFAIPPDTDTRASFGYSRPDGGGSLLYSFLDLPPTWRNAPDWQDGRDLRQIVARTIKRLRGE